MGDAKNKEYLKEYSLLQLDAFIAEFMGWKRHQGPSDIDCYSGLTCSTNNKGRLVDVVWTPDGVNGYSIWDLRSNKTWGEGESQKLKNILEVING